jgi:hypothetical protein
MAERRNSMDIETIRAAIVMAEVTVAMSSVQRRRSSHGKG